MVKDEGGATKHFFKFVGTDDEERLFGFGDIGVAIGHFGGIFGRVEREA